MTVTYPHPSQQPRSDVRVSFRVYIRYGHTHVVKFWLGTRDGPTQIDLGTDHYARNSSTGLDSDGGVGGGATSQASDHEYTYMYP